MAIEYVGKPSHRHILYRNTSSTIPRPIVEIAISITKTAHNSRLPLFRSSQPQNRSVNPMAISKAPFKGIGKVSSKLVIYEYCPYPYTCATINEIVGDVGNLRNLDDFPTNFLILPQSLGDFKKIISDHMIGCW
jgi:hypothetical protein